MPSVRPLYIVPSALSRSSQGAAISAVKPRCKGPNISTFPWSHGESSRQLTFVFGSLRSDLRSDQAGRRRYAFGQAGQPVVTAHVLTGYAVQRSRPQLLCACAAGLEIEDPFGTDANDLPLDKMRDAFVSDSKMMLEQASPPPQLLTCALYMRTLESTTPLPQ